MFGNLFAARHNKPASLRAMIDPVGPHNDDALTVLNIIAWRRVVAWGNDGNYLNRPKAVSNLLTDPQCLGLTSTGHPRHPLYVKGDTSLVAWAGT